MKTQIKLVIILIMLPFVTLNSQSREVSIIPEPNHYSLGEGEFVLSNSTKIVLHSDEGRNSLSFLMDYLKEYYGITPDIDPYTARASDVIFLNIKSDIEDTVEGRYELIVDQKSIYLNGDDPQALFYGVQTLIQLFDTKPNRILEIPAIKVEDSPRFEYRGMHLDVVRHIFPVSFIKRYIDYIAMHKMNYFHWHLTDDQGWRIECKRYPELNTIGSWRDSSIIGIFPGTDMDRTRYGGYYTEEEIREVIEYAAARYITIVPEIDIPGHCMAVIATFPQFSTTPDVPKRPAYTWGIYNRQNNVLAPSEEVFEFLENVFSDLADLFYLSPYIHIGGDECSHKWWKESATAQQFIKDHDLVDERGLQRYFVKRVSDIVVKKGRKAMAWDDIADDAGLVNDIMIVSWRGMRGGIIAAEAGHKAIMAPSRQSYLNYEQIENESRLAHRSRPPVSLERVYGLEPVPDTLSAGAKANIIGGQACMWTEYYATEEEVEYAIFPRMSASAETFWSSPEKKDYQNFLRKLESQYKRYDLWRSSYCREF